MLLVGLVGHAPPVHVRAAVPTASLPVGRHCRSSRGRPKDVRPQRAVRIALSGWLVTVSMVLTTAVGGGYSDGAQHSQCLRGTFAHLPGMKVVAPTTRTTPRVLSSPRSATTARSSTFP
jgi:hypothetical protein